MMLEEGDVAADEGALGGDNFRFLVLQEGGLAEADVIGWSILSLLNVKRL